MATAADAIDEAANRNKSVDESLWWDSFTDLFDELIQTTSLSSSLVNKLKPHHIWFVETFSMFKPPNQKSRSALDSNQLNVGSHCLTIQSHLKDLALQISPTADLDEVQSYILVEHYVERNNVDLGVQDTVQLILLHYFIERQCLLKCTRQIIMSAVYDENESGNADLSKIISDGLDRKLFTVIQDLLFSKQLENVDVDVSMLWAEEKLIEVNLVMDTLFVAYHESVCTCDGKQWRSLCSLYKELLSGSVNFQGMAMSFQAKDSLYCSKVHFFLILVGALDLETLLHMVHDEVPFGQGHSIFTLSDIQEMDAVVSSFNVIDTEEAAPLILAWAVFICLISSLPEKQDPCVLMDIDHVGYVRQAFKADPLGCILQILRSDMSRESEGAIAGYKSVLRTFVSAFIASYEIAPHLHDDTFSSILDIVCKIYRGEEALCVQFWDRDSFIDSPIRSLLNTLELEFPFRMTEFVRLLSALSEGTWPAECVYNYLDKSVGISSLFEVSDNNFAENMSQIVETSQPLHVPEVEDLQIPLQTVGRILKVIDKNIALVRWEYKQSGVLVLLMRLARQPYLNLSRETDIILDLFCRLVSLNTGVCSALMGFDYSFSVQKARNERLIEQSLRVDMVEIICALVRNLLHDVRSVEVMSMTITILTKMFKCSAAHVSEVVLKRNIFDVAVKINNFDVHLNDSGMWMLSGGLARMLSIDCEQTEDCCSLTLAVLDFTKQLVETGAEDHMSISLVVFSLQYVLVNHELWKYRVKHARWKVTLKALELMKVCIKSIPTSQKMAGIIREIILCDPSIHNTVFRLMCITSETLEKLHVSRVYEFEDIEGLQMAVCLALDVVFTLLTAFPKEILRNLPVFHQVMLTSAARSIPVVTGLISLISYFFDHAIQVGAAKVLSVLFLITENTEPYLFGIMSLISDDQQITDLKYSIYEILCEETPKDEELLVATLNLLTSAALHQPAFLLSIIAPKESERNVGEINQQSLKPSVRSPKKGSIVDALLHFVKRSENLIQSNPHILLNVLIFLKAMWQETTQYVQILGLFKSSEMFWKQLSSILKVVTDGGHNNLTEKNTLCQAYRYQCYSAVLEIMAFDLFVEEKLSGFESTGKQTSESKATTADNLRNVLLAWCESSALESLVNFSASCEYDSEVLLSATIASNMFLVHAIQQLVTADTGSLSLSLRGKIQAVSEKLKHHTAFSELLAEYSRHGYSCGQEVNTLVLNDLYYHIQGELEGRKTNSAKFKELAQLLQQFKFSKTEQIYARDFPHNASEVYVFDLVGLQKDLGLEYWDHSNWKTSKAVAEKMFLYMRDANLMSFLSNSKLCVLKSLSTLLSVYGENITSTKTTSIGRGISDTLISSCIEGICKCVQSNVDSLVPSMVPFLDIVNFIEAQVVLLLCLIRLLRRRFVKKANRQLSFHVCTLVLKTSASSLRVICSIRSSRAGLEAIVKLFLLVLLLSVEICHTSSGIQEEADKESIEGFAEVSLLCTSLLPILCCCTEIADCCNLSLATMDLILNCFLTSSTWLPIIQKHLQLQLVIQKLREKESSPSISVVLKFLSTIARVRGGAEMLQTAKFFLSLDNLFVQKPSFEVEDKRGLAAAASGGYEKPQNVWGLAMAVVTAMIYSLGDSSSCVDFVNSVIPYFFCENDFILLHHLDLPSDHEKKRAQMQKTQTSLTALKEIEHSLMLICVLSKQRKPALKAMKDICSRLRERSIHLLAFISRAGQRIGESLNRNALLSCPPTLKEEVELNRKPSFVHCKHGWFSLLPSGNLFSPYSSAVSSNALATQPSRDAFMVSPTEFSDLVAVQIYRNAYLLLTFLCLQAKEATSSAEEMGFINLARFPELPMPEILHGLQDQAIAIVSALCETNKSKQVQPEIQDICFLLLQIMEKSLFLEFCVAQICGIRPVLGRIEDFSKEFKMLVQVAEGHVFLKASLNSLRQIISCLYPGMLHTERFL